jgi:FkbM family methyltransferase
MQTGDGYVFCLDAPRVRPGAEPVEMAGWLAARQPITGLRMVGATEAVLAQTRRPDVEAAFRDYPCVVGFSGRVSVGDVRDGALVFAFSAGEMPQRVAVPLAPPPQPARGWTRWRAQRAAWWARRQLQGHPSPATRWNAGIDLWLAERRLRFGAVPVEQEGEALLTLFAEAFPEAVLLQIGANDGVTGDPLARWFPTSRWRGVLVEPIPHLAAALAARVAGRPGIAIERAAIAERDGVAKIFRLAHVPGQTPDWFQQLATFDRAVLLKHDTMIPDLAARIVEESVPTLTVATLLAQHRLTRVDLLVIDTEGYDWRILRQFDLGAVRPLVVLFEHQHLAAEEKTEALATLRRHGYRWIQTPEQNTLAWRRADRTDPAGLSVQNQA